MLEETSNLKFFDLLLLREATKLFVRADLSFFFCCKFFEVFLHQRKYTFIFLVNHEQTFHIKSILK